MSGIAQSASSRSRPATTRVAVDDALHAEAFEVGEALDGGEGADPLAGAGGDGLGDRVLGGVLEGAGEAQDLVAVDAVGRHDVDERHAAGGDGAGLVEHDGVDPAGRLEDLGALDEDAELGAPAGARPAGRSAWRARARRGRR